VNLIAFDDVIAVTVTERCSAIPASESSPIKSPAESSVIVASLPFAETTVTLNRPLWR
jgi:hypothetical protein